MRIGELADRTGASVRSLRYYEERGLIAAQRSSTGQRLFAEDSVQRVRLIRGLLSAGLGTEAISDVLPCLSEPATQTSELTRRLIQEHDRLVEEIRQRETMRCALQQIIDESPPLGATDIQ
ncbi:MerR family transcriptional regulator [Nesterenkonia sp. MY13]|uniref:MerR family transcriptional regulator n=1 Tax=Nesterenkonia sedimenti TaxID=1463632 RepID=A0A7X8YCR8_9MICC|nr:MerR family transcriptional regulator [Nesterenkonia sedimenti]NLS08888.1 MerR family transcriptional regulator [Nesterenkonia sedimenti]